MGKKEVLFLILSGLILTGCFHSKSQNTNQVSKNQDHVESNDRSEGDQQVSELIIEDLVTGSGEQVKEGDTVRVHYTGTFTDGTTFDSSRESGVPFDFVLGEGKVIKGWDIGVKGMRVGGRRKLTIPSQFAYGERGIEGVIPPNSTLIFDIEVLDVNPEEASD